MPTLANTDAPIIAADPDNKRFEDFVSRYIGAMLFTERAETDPETGEGDFLDKNHSAEDLAPRTLAKFRSDCEAFWIANGAAILALETACGPADQHVTDFDLNPDVVNARLAGYDFWMTRQGTGCGFADGDWPEPLATQLEDAAVAFKETYIELGDDGLIYQMATE